MLTQVRPPHVPCPGNIWIPKFNLNPIIFLCWLMIHASYHTWCILLLWPYSFSLELLLTTLIFCALQSLQLLKAAIFDEECAPCILALCFTYSIVCCKIILLFLSLTIWSVLPGYIWTYHWHVWVEQSVSTLLRCSVCSTVYMPTFFPM